MKIFFLILVLFVSTNSFSQDITYNRRIVDTLASPTFWGRGYTKNGMQKAAEFLAKEFKTLGLEPLGKKDYFQKFTHAVNTFPGDMEVSLNDKKLIPGVDYIIAPENKSKKIVGTLELVNNNLFVDNKTNVNFFFSEKLTWSVSDVQLQGTTIILNQNRINQIPKTYDINIDSKLLKKFDAVNICAMVSGTQKPDSFIFITAHYDHLGGMGRDTYFPGANDNASGVALLLSLAKYYASHPQKYSIGFILFAGEEIGLLGSKYYTEHPLVPLKNIRFLTNTDLAGTGSEGITVVNASIFPKEFALMNKINDEYKYLVSIAPRGKAANSDHHWFTELGIPTFFFYTKGGIAAYHDVFDKAATLPLNEQADLMQLMIKFNEGLQRK